MTKGMAAFFSAVYPEFSHEFLGPDPDLAVRAFDFNVALADQETGNEDVVVFRRAERNELFVEFVNNMLVGFNEHRE